MPDAINPVLPGARVADLDQAADGGALVSEMSASERRTVLWLLEIIKSAHVQSQSSDPAVVADARDRLLLGLTYLLGFLDGSGLSQAPQVKPGFETAFGAGQGLGDAGRELGGSIDEVVKMLREPLTRSTKGKVIGALVIAAGIAIKGLASYIRGDE